MTDELNNLKDIWQQGKNDPTAHIPTPHDIVQKAKTKQRKSRNAHFTTIAILLVTLLAIGYYYLFVMRYQLLVSHIGFGLMGTMLLVRIVLEAYSLKCYAKIDIAHNAKENLEQTIRFVRLRQQIHGTVSITILVAYIIGFVLLGKEMYLTLPSIFFYGFYAMFVVLAIVLTLIIRKGVQKELQHLRQLVTLLEELQ